MGVTPSAGTQPNPGSGAPVDHSVWAMNPNTGEWEWTTAPTSTGAPMFDPNNTGPNGAPGGAWNPGNSGNPDGTTGVNGLNPNGQTTAGVPNPNTGGAAPPNFTPGGVSGTFDLPQYQGQMTAPLTGGQLDVLDTFNNTGTNGMLGATPTPTNFSTSGDWLKNLFTGPTDPNLASVTNTTAGAYGSAINAPSFDQTTEFKAATDLFNNKLNDTIANTKEEYSGLGLGAGSTDRGAAITRAAGDATNNFVINREQLANQAFEAAQQRKIAALGMAPNIASAVNTQNVNRLNALPAAITEETTPYNQQMQTQQNNINNQVAKFNVNEAARSVAQNDATARSNEFSRTQGGQLQQILSILQAGSPLNSTGFGPSAITQGADAAGGIAKLVAAK